MFSYVTAKQEQPETAGVIFAEGLSLPARAEILHTAWSLWLVLISPAS